MPGLLDIAPPEIATERFEIRGGHVEVRGIRNKEWAALLRRFPDLMRQQVSGNGEVDPDMLDRLCEIMPPVIAAAAGACGDAGSEAAIAERLTESEQQQIFNAIMRLTNPPSPLAESPVAAGQSNGKAATTSPTPSSS